MSLPANPIWRKTPFLLFRWPPILAAVLASFVVLVVAASVGPLFTSASAAGALDRQLVGITPAAAGLTVLQETPLEPVMLQSPGGEPQEVSPTELHAFRRRGLDRALEPIDHLGPPISSMVLGASTLASPEGELAVRPTSRDGFVDHVEIVTEVEGDGLWVPDNIAEALAIEAGDEVELTVDAPTAIRVKGIYRDLTLVPASAYWRPVDRYIHPQRPQDADPPALLLGDPEDLIEIGTKTETFAVAIWEYPIVRDGLTFEEARTIRRQLSAVSGDALDTSTDVGFYLNEPEVQTVLPIVVDTAAEVVAGIRLPVQVLVLTGAGVALLLVAISAHYMVQKRAVEFRLLESRGVSHVFIGLRAIAEAVVPVVLATAMGSVGTWLMLKAFGPGPVDPSALADSARFTAACVVIGLAALGIGTALVARRHMSVEHSAARVGAGRPWEISLLVAAGAALFTIRERGGVGQGDGSVGDLLLVVWPILAVAGAALLVLKLGLGYLRRGLRVTEGSGTALFLATRRLVAAARSVALLIGAAAVSVGILTYSTALLASVRTTTHAKTHVFTGSDVSLQVSNLDLPDVNAPHTVVGTTAADADGEEVTLMGIDPDTFAAGAYWDETFANDPLSSLVERVASTTAEPLPVIVAGSQADVDVITVETTGAAVEIDVVGRARTWPGMVQDTPMIIGDLTSIDDIEGVSFETLNLWAKGPIEVVFERLRQAGFDTDFAITTDDVGRSSRLLSISWTFGLLRVLGLVAGSLAVVGMLLYVASRRRTRLVSYLLGRRMGLTPSVHMRSLAIELLVMLMSALILGALFGIVSARLVYPELDLLPEVPPEPLFRLPVTEVVATAIGFVLAGVIGAALIQRSGDRARPGEVLRLAD